MGETSKAKERRTKEGWFEKYAPAGAKGIDIGCQEDPIHEGYRKWDLILGDSDATEMLGIPDNEYDIVYSSHILEHLDDPVTGVKNWYRIVAPGGNLVILVPHKLLYERKEKPPSNWNVEHKTFWLPETEEPPFTRSFKGTILEAIPNANIISFRILDIGYDYSIPPLQHAVGEYSIEAIVKKP